MKARSSQKPKPKRRGQVRLRLRLPKLIRLQGRPYTERNPDSPETSRVQKQKGSTLMELPKALLSEVPFLNIYLVPVRMLQVVDLNTHCFCNVYLS